jgi:hypothetical protein
MEGSRFAQNRCCRKTRSSGIGGSCRLNSEVRFIHWSWHLEKWVRIPANPAKRHSGGAKLRGIKNCAEVWEGCGKIVTAWR